MNAADFSILLSTVRSGALSREQLIDLYSATAGRVCQFDEPEFEAAIGDISDAEEALKDALAAHDQRPVSRHVDEMTLAKWAAEAAL